MNEEEKKVIKMLDKFTTEHKFYNIKYSGNLEDNIEIVLKLIEKLQKENKELKEYIAIAPNLDEMTEIKYRYIRQDGYIQGRVEEQQKAKQIINENYISKEKIEDKVRELECYIQENSDDQGYWGNRNPDVIYGQIEILQELIEEREEK